MSAPIIKRSLARVVRVVMEEARSIFKLYVLHSNEILHDQLLLLITWQPNIWTRIWVKKWRVYMLYCQTNIYHRFVLKVSLVSIRLVYENRTDEVVHEMVQTFLIIYRASYWQPYYDFRWQWLYRAGPFPLYLGDMTVRGLVVVLVVIIKISLWDLKWSRWY